MNPKRFKKVVEWEHGKPLLIFLIVILMLIGHLLANLPIWKGVVVSAVFMVVGIIIWNNNLLPTRTVTYEEIK